jgi:integrase
MATTIPYKDRWRTVVRRVGYKDRTKVTATHDEGEKWGRAIEAEMDVKTYVAPTGTRVKEIFEKFRDEISETRPGKRWEQIRIDKFIGEIQWINKVIEEVDRHDIEAWMTKRLKTVSSSTVRRELNLISSIFKHAMRKWNVGLKANPAREVDRPPEPPHRTRRPTAEESATLDKFMKFDESKPPRKGMGAVTDSVMWAYHIAEETGLRASELFRLEWEDVHLDDAWLHVNQSKNGDERDVPLTERAEELLRKLGPSKGRVFPVNPGSMETTWRAKRNAAGIKGLRRHDLRREAATNMSQTLTNLELSKTLGHRDPRTVMIYYEPTPKALANKLRKKV